jgi:hypothetical protein
MAQACASIMGRRMKKCADDERSSMQGVGIDAVSSNAEMPMRDT